MSAANGNAGDGFDRRLEESLNALGASPADAPAMGDELARELSDLAAVRTRAPRRELVMVIAISLLYAGLLLGLLGLRRDMDEMPLAWLLGAGGLWLLSFGCITWLVLMPSRDQVMPRWRWAAAISALAAGVFIAGGMLRPESVAEAGTTYALSPASWLDHGHRCLRWGLAVAVVPAVLTAMAVRGAVPVGSRWTAAAIGAAGGSLGGLMLHLHCPIGERFHVGLAHGGLVVTAAVLTALMARVDRRQERRQTSKAASEQA
ncbi:MAG TPA: NrsF family protein [Kofleriaceae bacterium]|nr:NrsF family protein [Kofleriaceae bacterium]